jgi:hypothetical protein
MPSAAAASFACRRNRSHRQAVAKSEDEELERAVGDAGFNLARDLLSGLTAARISAAFVGILSTINRTAPLPPKLFVSVSKRPRRSRSHSATRVG